MLAGGATAPFPKARRKARQRKPTGPHEVARRAGEQVPPSRHARRDDGGTGPSRNRPLSELAYRELRRRIIFQDFPGGLALDEMSAARALKLGRTPVREAIQMLARDGLVKVYARRGTFVSEMSLETLRQVCETRAPIEEQVARRAALRAEAADIEKMRHALAGVDTLIEQRRFRDLVEADERFHLALAGAARNPLLQELVVKLHGLAIRFWYPTLTQRPPDDIREEMALHRHVLAAVEEHDPDKAAKAMLVLAGGFFNRVTEILKGTIP